MNLLGRLLVVLILIGSIILMAFSVSLYATHTNWRDRAVGKDGNGGLKKQLGDKTKELNDLETLKATMEASLQREIKRQADTVVALTEKCRQLANNNEEVKVEIVKLRAELAEQVAAVRDAHDAKEKLQARLDGASKAYFDAQNDWVDMSTQLTKKIDESHSLALQIADYQVTCAQLAKDYANVMEVLRIHNLLDDPAQYSRKPPGNIRGVISEVRPRGVVEISVGSDSGLSKGHQLDVVRNRDGRSSYIGKIEITQTAPDRAVANVMPEFRRGVVQRDDEIMYIEVNELTAH